uniref:Uncharacterized protein n=1 Tax=Mastacembelus armatus TaxID=205130 RepID=A0A3Q3SB49_9TELE
LWVFGEILKVPQICTQWSSTNISGSTGLVESCWGLFSACICLEASILIFIMIHSCVYAFVVAITCSVLN